MTEDMVERTARVMWERTHDGSWPQDAEASPLPMARATGPWATAWPFRLSAGWVNGYARLKTRRDPLTRIAPHEQSGKIGPLAFCTAKGEAMTTIAYRDGIMAADSMITRNDEWIMPYSAPKITRLQDGSLCGFAGNFFKQDAFLKWLGDPTAPRPDLETDCAALVVNLDGSVWMYQYVGGVRLEGPFFAVGSGSVPALAAMHMGADAGRAVAIAARLDNATGGNIIEEHLR